MDDVAYREAMVLALKRLETSDRLESEVRQALRAFSVEIADRVVMTLQEKRFLNDERVVSHVIERNQGRRAVGDALLADRLVRRGADETLVAGVLQEAEPEAERIRAILSGKYHPSDPPAKAGRFLFGRGFSEEAIESALADYFDAPEAD